MRKSRKLSSSRHMATASPSTRVRNGSFGCQKNNFTRGVRDISKPVISIHKTDKVCKIPEHAKESNETETLVSLTFAAADKINDILNV